MSDEESKQKKRVMKKSRAERDYGLPRLTVEEAARFLGITPTALTDWIVAKVPYTPQKWANWRTGEKLPEALIRLYLTQQRAEPVRLREIGGAGRAAERPEGAKRS